MADSIYPLQDDFDDLCEILTDRIGQPSHTLFPALHQQRIPALASAPSELLEEKSNNTCSALLLDSNSKGLSTIHGVRHCELSCNKTLAPELARDVQPGKVESAKIQIDKAMIANNTSPQAISDAIGMGQLAGELQILAEMTGRLRKGLDRLLALPESNLTFERVYRQLH